MSWKKIEYKGNDSVDRLQGLQTLCTSSESKLDGILIIGGVDSFHSQASQAALKYLFLGSSGQELLGEQVISHEHEWLEDVILLIGPQRVSIFYSSESEAAVKILPVISKWRHVTEYVVHDRMELDKQEERKIRAFKQMMTGIKCIGVPFGLDLNDTNLQDTMLPEKWPLFQSYGLEDGESTGKGFFTMNHRVVNVSWELKNVMAQLDEFSSKRVVQESQPFLAHHFNEFLMKMDHAESPEVRNSKSETDLGEDLLSFYEFGTMQYSARGLKTTSDRGSRVLFGVRTSNLTEKSTSTAFLANSGVQEGVSATHMVVQAEDPFTGVRFTRTYFLSSGKICKRVVDEDALVPSTLEPDAGTTEGASNTTVMIELYALLLEGFKAGAAELIRECMDHKFTGLDRCMESARAEAIHAIFEMDKTRSQLLGSSKIPTKFIDDQLYLKAEIMDARGQPVDSLSEDWCLVYCSVTLGNIPSNANSAASLGSLVVGDTFLFRGSVSDYSDKRILTITKPFAYFRSWIQGGEEAEAVNLLLRTLQSEFITQSRSVCLGKAVVPVDANIEANAVEMSSKAMILLDNDLMPIIHGTWRIFTGGMVFTSPYFNPIIVSIERHVKSLTILPSSYEELVLLKLELKEDSNTRLNPVSEVLPFSFNCPSLFIPLLSGTRLQDEVFHALEEWKITAKSLNIRFFRTSDLSEKFQGDTPRDHEIADFDVPIHVKSTCELLVHKQPFIGQDARAIEDFFRQDFIPRDPNAVTTLPKPNTEYLNRLCVPVTVMIGIPGSGAQAMATSICKISSASFEWSLVKVDLRDLDISKQQKLEAAGYFMIYDRLTQALDRIKTTTKTLQLHPRIMLCVIGYVDPIMVACAIRRAGKQAPLLSKIGAIINCLSATNVYLPDPLATQVPFPKVFDQMITGFVTHSVLTNSADVTPAILQRLRFHMDQVNPFADVMVLSHDVFEGPLTPLLAIDRFESAYYKQYRNAHYHQWDIAARDNAAPAYTRYVAELESSLAPVSFRFEIAPDMDRAKFSYLIIKTLTPFAALTKSMDRVYPVESNKTKGIRIAQALAAEKVQDTQKSGFSAAISCAEDEPGCVYEYRSTGTLSRLWPASDHSTRSTEMKFTGLGLNAEKLRALLLNCYPHSEASPNQIQSKATISLEEKREIQRQHAMDPLPEGYLFDGINYVDFFGGRYEFHPCIAQFIDEYVTAANDDRKATNMKASQERESQLAFVIQLT